MVSNVLFVIFIVVNKKLKSRDEYLKTYLTILYRTVCLVDILSYKKYRCHSECCIALLEK